MLETYEVPMVCPACSMVNKRTLGWLKANAEYTCADCGAKTGIDPSFVERATYSVEQDLARIRAAESGMDAEPSPTP
jgi:transposase-like protein